MQLRYLTLAASVWPYFKFHPSPGAGKVQRSAQPEVPDANKDIAKHFRYCTVRQCSPLRQKLMECSIINPAVSLLMNHLVIDQRQKAPNFSAFYWSPNGSLVSNGQHFVTTRVVLLPKRTKTNLITESDRSGPHHRIGPGCAGRA